MLRVRSDKTFVNFIDVYQRLCRERAGYTVDICSSTSKCKQVRKGIAELEKRIGKFNATKYLTSQFSFFDTKMCVKFFKSKLPPLSVLFTTKAINRYIANHRSNIKDFYEPLMEDSSRMTPELIRLKQISQSTKGRKFC